MNVNEILNIVLAVLSVLVSGVGYYFKIKEMLVKNANALIDDAEDIAKDGELKMKYVVHELQLLVPIAYRPLFTEQLLTKIVQCAFDKIESYAEKQVEKK